MFAVVRTGGKQYSVAANDMIRVERLAGTPGDVIELSDVLLIGEGADIKAGSGQTVAAEIVEQTRDDTIIVFKKTRRHTYRRRNGHRQQRTVLRILGIGADAARAKPAVATADKAAPVAATLTGSAPAGGTTLDASNLSLISGIGPTIEKKLRAAGIASWNDIAAWDADAVAKWDAELKLGGRPTRDEWVEQAKELLAGKPPRAKVDQAEAASGKDL